MAGGLLWQPNGHPVLFIAGRGLTDASLFGTAVTHWRRIAADAERLLGEDHPQTVSARGSLAASYWRVGRTGEAIVIGERVLADSQGLLGEDHPHTRMAADALRSRCLV